MLADGMVAAAENERDFGISRRQLCGKFISGSLGREGGSIDALPRESLERPYTPERGMSGTGQIVGNTTSIKVEPSP
jgi:hypothetical protein